jgi:hypothetical protein
LEILAGSGIESLSDALAVGPQGRSEGTSLVQRVERFGRDEGYLITLRALDPSGIGGLPADPSATANDRTEEDLPPPDARPPANPFADPAPTEVKSVPPSPPPVDGRPDWERD